MMANEPQEQYKVCPLSTVILMLLEKDHISASCSAVINKTLLLTHPKCNVEDNESPFGQAQAKSVHLK